MYVFFYAADHRIRIPADLVVAVEESASVYCILLSKGSPTHRTCRTNIRPRNSGKDLLQFCGRIWKCQSCCVTLAGQPRRIAAQFALLHRKRSLCYAANAKSARRSAKSSSAAATHVAGVCGRSMIHASSFGFCTDLICANPPCSGQPWILTERPSPSKEILCRSVTCFPFRVVLQ